MIISASKRFIFIHNPKAAGTSIRRALSPWDTGRGVRAKTKHETINEFLTRTQYDISGYFVFGFVRNPWDRFSSFYHFLKGRSEQYPEINTVRDVNELAQRIDEPWLRNRYSIQPQHQYFNKRVNFIGRYEELSTTIPYISKKLGVPIKIGHANKSANRKYVTLFTDEGREIIAGRYAKDIKLYGYTFGEPK